MKMQITDNRSEFIEGNCSRCIHRYRDCILIPRINYLGKVWHPVECPDFDQRPLTEQELEELRIMLDEIL